MTAKETQPRKNTKLLLTILFTVVVSITLIFLLQQERDSTPTTVGPPRVGLPVPNFTLPNLNGQKVSLSDHRGRVVMINIWATWCQPCRQEMPSLQKLYERFKGENFEILAVSIDSKGGEAVGPYMRKMNLTFPALLDPKASIRPLYGLTGVPESFIIDKQGILVKKVIGPMDWATSEVFRFFQDLIEQPRS